MSETKAKWTEEPWELDEHGYRILATVKGFKPTAAHPEFVVAQCSTYCCGESAGQRANASRIVACVNALSGIEDPAAMREELIELKSLVNSDKYDGSALCQMYLAQAEAFKAQAEEIGRLKAVILSGWGPKPEHIARAESAEAKAAGLEKENAQLKAEGGK
jgi:hypothetical protein